MSWLTWLLVSAALLLLVDEVLVGPVKLVVSVDVGVVLDGVPGVPDISSGELGERNGSASSSSPFGVGSLFNSSLSNL